MLCLMSDIGEMGKKRSRKSKCSPEVASFALYFQTLSRKSEHQPSEASGSDPFFRYFTLFEH